jgi:phage portal protein BeeE
MVHMFDGTGMRRVSLWSDDGWVVPGGDGVDEIVAGPTGAYRGVPYVYRAVDVRAKAVSSIPWRLVRPGSGRDVRDERAYQGLVRSMRERLYLTEAALCVHGAAYWLKERNRAGRNLTPRWAAPASVVPQFDAGVGLVCFLRVWGHGGAGSPPADDHRDARVLQPEDVVHFWMPNVGAELGPGVAPVRVALGAARVLHSLDGFVDGFFRRGAVRMTLLTVDGNPPRTELDRLESWWRRLVGGVRTAWQGLAVRSSVKPVTIGDGLADMENEELVNQQRENVCAALGVPHSLLSADAATYATAQADRLNFYEQTVVPQVQLIEDVINEQLLEEVGLQLVFEPGKLEVFQQYEVEKSQSLVPLVTAGVMTVDEARAWMGLG